MAPPNYRFSVVGGTTKFVVQPEIPCLPKGITLIKLILPCMIEFPQESLEEFSRLLSRNAREEVGTRCFFGLFCLKLG